MLKALILDMDGTLADTEPYHRQAFNLAFQEADIGWHWDAAEYGRLLRVSGGLRRMHEYAARHPLAVSVGQLDGFLRHLHGRKSELYRELIRTHRPDLRPGVARLLAAARLRNIGTAIATNSSKHNLEELFSQEGCADLLSHFQTVLTADKVPQMKPDPAIYLRVLELNGVQAQHCVAVEDTSAGNQAALRAGILTVITTHDYVRDHAFDGAALVVSHLGDPDNPCEVYAGGPLPRPLVDLELLESLLQARDLSGGGPGWD